MQPASAAREPEMNALRGGSFNMGSNDDITERPTHQVTIKPFSISKYPITVREWNQCSDAKACAFAATGKDDAPVTNVSWTDAKQFVAWLAATTRKPYRLPSEAEWEYAARGGTQTKYWWGDQMQTGMANCKNCSEVAAGRSALANQVRLVLHTAAYWLMLTVRDAIPKARELATAEFATLRLRLLKIAARVVETTSRIRLAFAAACPEADLFRSLPGALLPLGP